MLGFQRRARGWRRDAEEALPPLSLPPTLSLHHPGRFHCAAPRHVSSHSHGIARSPSQADRSNKWPVFRRGRLGGGGGANAKCQFSIKSKLVRKVSHLGSVTLWEEKNQQQQQINGTRAGQNELFGSTFYNGNEHVAQCYVDSDRPHQTDSYLQSAVLYYEVSRSKDLSQTKSLSITFSVNSFALNYIHCFSTYQYVFKLNYIENLQSCYSIIPRFIEAAGGGQFTDALSSVDFRFKLRPVDTLCASTSDMTQTRARPSDCGLNQ